TAGSARGRAIVLGERGHRRQAEQEGDCGELFDLHSFSFFSPVPLCRTLRLWNAAYTSIRRPPCKANVCPARQNCKESVKIRAFCAKTAMVNSREPICPAQIEAMMTQNPTPSKGPTRVLVIDDDRKLCRLIRDYLGPMGYDVELAHTGPEGLERA